MYEACHDIQSRIRLFPNETVVMVFLYVTEWISVKTLVALRPKRINPRPHFFISNAFTL